MNLNNENAEYCCVCLEENIPLKRTQCNHIVCNTCLSKLKKCPLCRKWFVNRKEEIKNMVLLVIIITMFIIQLLTSIYILYLFISQLLSISIFSRVFHLQSLKLMISGLMVL